MSTLAFTRARSFTRPRSFTRARIRQQLGEERAALLFAIAERAAARALPLFLVGGGVRAGLLAHHHGGGRPGKELDLMLPGRSLGDAIDFARGIQAELGGELRPHARFGTAQWRTPAAITVDFACARRERYPRPGQLPQPSPGSIEEDLWRRDFSINALALQLSPAADFGQLLDPCGGMRDLEKSRLRALHPASFRDDPTRFLRGLRLAARLNLRWEEETARWGRASIPRLARLSGSRLRAEIEHILREPRPEAPLIAQEAAGLLPTLHSAFITDADVLRERFAAAREAAASEKAGASPEAPSDPVAIGWRLLTMGSAPSQVATLAARFTLRKAERAGLERAARLYAERDALADEHQPPATLATALENADGATRRALWICGDAALRRQLARYEEDWRQRRAVLTGQDLRQLGLRPGPCYRQLLAALQVARWNGAVTSAAEEWALLARLLAEGDSERA